MKIKDNLPNNGLAVPEDLRERERERVGERERERELGRKRESEKRDKNRYLARELKTIEHEDDGDTNCNWCT